MIRALAFLIIVLAGLCLSPWLVGNTGYVYIAAGDYQVETSLVFGMLIMLVVFGLVQLIEWLLIKLLTIAFNSRLLPERWRRNAARKNTLTGALALAAEDWQLAETAMAKGAQKGELPALNLLAAARAAQHQQNYEQRDSYLEQAEAFPQAQQAVRTSRVRYLMQQQAWELAAQELEKLHPGPRSSKPVLKLALELYRHQEDWGNLTKLLPILHKKQIVEQNELSQLTRTMHIRRLSQACDSGLPQLELVWGDLSRHEKQQAEFIALYCRGLSRFNQQEKSQKLLLKSLKKHLDPDLISALTETVQSTDTSALQFLANIEPAEQNSAAYHQAMACMQHRLREFKDAKAQWVKVCELAPSRQAWLALGELQQQLGDNGAALNSFHQAAKL